MKLTGYGHFAFRIEAGAAKILIDPFLSDNPSWDKDRMALRVRVEKKFSTALSHDPEVGVKRTQRG